jgi:hypothetical protein
MFNQGFDDWMKQRRLVVGLSIETMAERMHETPDVVIATEEGRGTTWQECLYCRALSGTVQLKKNEGKK